MTPTRPAYAHPVRIHVLTAAMAVIGVAGLLLLPSDWPSPAYLLLVASLVGVSEVAAVRAKLGSGRWTVSLTEAVVAACLLLNPGAWLILAIAAGVVPAQIIRKRTLEKCIFNVGMHATITTVAVIATLLLPTGPWWVFLAMMAFWLCNITIVARAASWATGKPMLQLVRNQITHSVMHAASNSSLGLIAATLIPLSAHHALLLLPPAAFLLFAYVTVWREHDSAELLEQIVTANDALRTSTAFGVASKLIATCKGVLGAKVVKVLILEDQTATAYQSGTTPSRPVEPLAGPEALQSWWARTAMSRPEAVTHGVRDGKSWMVLRVGPQTEPDAIVALSRTYPRGGFTRSELRVAKQLQQYAVVWTSALKAAVRERHAAQAISDHAARNATLPHHQVAEVINATARLAETAEAPARDVKTIVSELHRVEYAVAALVGSAMEEGAQVTPSPTSPEATSP